MKEVNKEIPNKILIGEIRNALQQGHTATLRVKGVSMRPFLETLRDKVVLAPPQREKIQTGDVVLAAISKDIFVLHRVTKREGERLTLRGDGNVCNLPRNGRAGRYCDARVGLRQSRRIALPKQLK